MALLTQLHLCTKNVSMTEPKPDFESKNLFQVENVPFFVPKFAAVSLLPSQDSPFHVSGVRGRVGGHGSLLLALLFLIPASSILPSHPLPPFFFFFCMGGAFPLWCHFLFGKREHEYS